LTTGGTGDVESIGCSGCSVSGAIGDSCGGGGDSCGAGGDMDGGPFGLSSLICTSVCEYIKMVQEQLLPENYGSI
jgi:hypothetical protein